MNPSLPSRPCTMAAILLITAASWTLPAAAQTAFPATLAGHAVLPALSLIPAPKDAPADLQVSGKFTTGQRVEKIGSVAGLSAGRPTGVFLPFKGQPAQGHSGIKRMADGSYRIQLDAASFKLDLTLTMTCHGCWPRTGLKIEARVSEIGRASCRERVSSPV